MRDRALFVSLVALLALLFVSLAVPATAQRAVIELRPGSGVYAGEVVVPINKSQVVQLDRTFDGASIANPEVANIVPLSARAVYVFGTSLGSTSLTLTDPDGGVLAVVDVVVSHDLDRLKRQLHTLYPSDRVRVRAAGAGVVLDGEVANASRLANILSVAQKFAPGAVTNLLEVTKSEQVMLHVRFAEMQRELVKQLGVNLGAVFDDGVTSVGIISGDGPSLNPLSFVAASFGLQTGNWSLDALIDALEQENVVRILAEPNLIALSGDTASFLAGGEFPVPVASSTSGGVAQVTVEFKEFGVGLSFTPTVIGNDLVNLELFTEVSDIDPNNSVRTSGIAGVEIPGLRVRRATTTVELRNGQSFAIAGLLSDQLRNDIRGVPGIGDVPILGSLFRSSGYQSRQTELVILVTPYLVRPATPDALKTPLESFVPPSELDLFLLGRTERRPSAVEELGAQAAGGLAGPHGYLLR
ncbi:MAG: type II and III secretion system protein family protein [Pseudomonadota bacterium]